MTPVAPANDAEAKLVAPAYSAAETPARPAAGVWRALRVPAGRKSAHGNKPSCQRNWNTSENLRPPAKLQQQPAMTRFEDSDVVVPPGPRSPTPWAWAARQPGSDTNPAPEPPGLATERPPASARGQGWSGSGLALDRSPVRSPSRLPGPSHAASATRSGRGDRPQRRPPHRTRPPERPSAV